MYAKTFFDNYRVDALTVAPYMGEDSVTPFLNGHDNSWVILLALTSNKGSADFQQDADANGERLFEKVIRKSQAWGTPENMMYVVGATRGEMFKDVRKVAPDHFLLVPGVGAQGGSLQEVCEYGMIKDCGLLVNSSRGIIYADNTEMTTIMINEGSDLLNPESSGLTSNDYTVAYSNYENVNSGDATLYVISAASDKADGSKISFNNEEIGSLAQNYDATSKLSIVKSEITNVLEGDNLVTLQSINDNLFAMGTIFMIKSPVTAVWAVMKILNKSWECNVQNNNYS
jgi:hypothetical protein